jgi:hypothetical protein
MHIIPVPYDYNYDVDDPIRHDATSFSNSIRQVGDVLGETESR